MLKPSPIDTETGAVVKPPGHTNTPGHTHILLRGCGGDTRSPRLGHLPPARATPTPPSPPAPSSGEPGKAALLVNKWHVGEVGECLVRTLQGFSQEPSVHKVSGVFARASPVPAVPLLCSVAHRGFPKEKGQKERAEGATGGLGLGNPSDRPR